MSLLNDALRAAEQRQKRPEVATAYVGRSQKRQGNARWLVPLLLLIIVVLAVLTLYEFFSREPAQPLVVEQSETEATVAQAIQNVPLRPVEITGSIAAEPDPILPEPSPAPAPVAVASLPKQVTRSSVDPARPETDVSVSPAAEKSVVAKSTSAKAVAQAETEDMVGPPAEEPAIPAVKQQRETPEAADLRASRKLTRLLQAGKLDAAEALMRQLEKTQVAPVSRGVLARSLLIQGLPDRALDWLSLPEAADYPALRLLKSRGLLATGDLVGALATLLQDVPPVKNHIEYRVTLATLLQQSGQGMASARQWSALLAVDDGRAAWWVGLAIALESQGEARAAVRAYGQAARLPGLSPSLADYVRERMHKLQAG